MKKIICVILITFSLVFADDIYLIDGRKIINCKIISVKNNQYEFVANENDNNQLQKIQSSLILYVNYKNVSQDINTQWVNIGDKILSEVDSIKLAKKINTEKKIEFPSISKTNIHITKEGAEVFRLMHTMDNVIWGVSGIALGALCVGYGLYIDNIIKSDSYFSDLKGTRNLMYGLGGISAGFGIFIIFYENENWKVKSTSNSFSVSYKF